MASRRHVAKVIAGVKAGTVLDHYTEVYGVHKGSYRAAHMAQMALVALEYGREWSAREYAEWWGVDERVAFTHRAEAREVYGDAWRDVALLLAEELRRRETRAPGRIVRLPLPAT